VWRYWEKGRGRTIGREAKSGRSGGGYPQVRKKTAAKVVVLLGLVIEWPAEL
jgi:hypothetical protein